MRSAAARSNLLVPELREVMDIRQASGYLGISPGGELDPAKKKPVQREAASSY